MLETPEIQNSPTCGPRNSRRNAQPADPQSPPPVWLSANCVAIPATVTLRNEGHQQLQVKVGDLVTGDLSLRGLCGLLHTLIIIIFIAQIITRLIACFIVWFIMQLIIIGLIVQLDTRPIALIIVQLISHLIVKLIVWLIAQIMMQFIVCFIVLCLIVQSFSPP